VTECHATECHGQSPVCVGHAYRVLRTHQAPGVRPETRPGGGACGPPSTPAAAADPPPSCSPARCQNLSLSLSAARRRSIPRRFCNCMSVTVGTASPGRGLVSSHDMEHAAEHPAPPPLASTAATRPAPGAPCRDGPRPAAPAGAAEGASAWTGGACEAAACDGRRVLSDGGVRGACVLMCAWGVPVRACMCVVAGDGRRADTGLIYIYKYAQVDIYIYIYIYIYMAGVCARARAHSNLCVRAHACMRLSLVWECSGVRLQAGVSFPPGISVAAG
jgi:hypothetical protein